MVQFGIYDHLGNYITKSNNLIYMITKFNDLIYVIIMQLYNDPIVERKLSK